jgi:chemotaxis protein MotB
MLRVEAFGRFHPRHTVLTADGRRKNRRVDIILDKRNAQWQAHMGLLHQPGAEEVFEYKDFIFRFENRGAPGAPEGP